LKIIFRENIPFKFITIIILLFLSVLFLSSCSKEQKIKEETFVKIYSDLVIAQDSLAADSTGFETEKKNIFLRYKVTKEFYINTLEHYKNNPQEWKSLFKKVIVYLREQEKKKKP